MSRDVRSYKKARALRIEEVVIACSRLTVSQASPDSRLFCIFGDVSLMKHSGSASGFSLSKELSSLAEFRLYTAEKLQLLEKLVSGIDGSIGSAPGAPSKIDPTTRFGDDHDPEITRSCLHLLVVSACPLTIGQICAELQVNSSLSHVGRTKNSENTREANYKPIETASLDTGGSKSVRADSLSLVCKSLHWLANLALAAPVECAGIRKWTWTGGATVGNKRRRTNRNELIEKRTDPHSL